MTISAERAERQLSYVLHSRPYRETSALVDYFSRDQGLIRAVVKGVRGTRSRQRQLIQPFQSLELNWRGKGELKTLASGDLAGTLHPLQGRSLWCGLYLNELTLRLLPQSDPLPELFAYYQLALTHLTDPQQQEAVLRIYERRLLEQLGLGIDFGHCRNGERIEAGQQYYFDPQQGFESAVLARPKTSQRLLSGEQLLAIGADDYQDVEVRRSAKGLMRSALAQLLGDKPLRSRELFQQRVTVASSRSANDRSSEERL